MSKVVVANWFDVNDINEVSKRTRADDGSQLLVVRRVSQDYKDEWSTQFA